MSKFDDVVDRCKTQLDKQKVSYDETALRGVAKSLGPSIYNKDSLLVAASDKAEMDKIKTNFLIGKMGCKPSDDLDGILSKAVETIGRSNTQKLRPAFYYILAQQLGKVNTYK